jgi:hypothetical protein
MPSSGTFSRNVDGSLWLPDDLALLAFNMDPVNASQGNLLVSGTIEWVLVGLNGGLHSVTNIIVNVGTAGNTLTSGQSLAGLYSIASNGTVARIGQTADQSAVWTSTGLKTMALASGPFDVAGSYCYVAFLSVGTTPPTFRGGQSLNGMANGGLPGTAAQPWRFALGATSQTALPASISLPLASNTGHAIYVALS